MEVSKEFIFDLQLFAEDGNVASGDAEGTQVEDVEGDQADGETAGNPTNADDGTPGDSMGIVVDPKTGKRTVQRIAQPEEGQRAKEQETEPAGEDPAPEQYTAQGLIQAVQSGVVDEVRIPDEFKLQYATYKQQLMQQQAQQQEQPTKESPAPEQPQSDLKEVYRQLSAAALENTLAELGMTEEDYEVLSYNDDPQVKSIFEVAYQTNIQRLITKSQEIYAQEQARRNEKKAIYEEVNSFVQIARQSDRNFDTIDSLMMTRYKTMPYEKAEMVAKAIDSLKNGTITREQLPILEAYYKETREAFYASKSGVSTTPAKRSTAKPPVVEKAGNGASVKEQIDFSEMRNMSRKEKTNLLDRYFAQRNK